MTLRRLLFGLAVLSISVLTTAVDTQAKGQLSFRPGQRAESNSYIPKAALRPASTQTRSRVHAVSLSKRELEKLVKSAVRRCGCTAAAQDTEFSSGCVKNCVAKYVGWGTVLACGTACSGNAVGCAVCVGVHEWVVLGCIQYCAWLPVFSAVDGPVASNRVRPPTKRQGKSLTKLLVSASSS